MTLSEALEQIKKVKKNHVAEKKNQSDCYALREFGRFGRFSVIFV